MNAPEQYQLDPQAIRNFRVPKDVYLSPAFNALEKQLLWRRVWQIACREQQIVNVGDFITYDIADQSILLVRTEKQGLRAYHNVCRHRGRRLKDGGGHIASIQCPFHGWRWNLDGVNERVLDRQDWEGCPDMADDDLKLSQVRVETWGGWVFVNLDSGAEPLLQYLSPAAQRLNPFEFEHMRVHWHKTFELNCNWKVALEAFNEGYHVFATHPQMANYFDDVTRSHTYGKHGMFGYPTSRGYGAPSARTGKPLPQDWRPGIVQYNDEMLRTLNAIVTGRDAAASHRLLTEVAPDSTQRDVMGKLKQFQKEAAVATGVPWPEITVEQRAQAGADWHIFPNHVVLSHHSGALAYRSRPLGDDPDRCLYDVYALERYAPGAEPPLRHEFFTNWRECKDLGLILTQDFTNMEAMQKGMKSDGFAASRTNPRQESVISNFHRVLREYVSETIEPVVRRQRRTGA